MKTTKTYRIEKPVYNPNDYNLSSDYLLGLDENNNEIIVLASQFTIGQVINEKDIQLIRRVEDPVWKYWSLYSKKSALASNIESIPVHGFNYNVAQRINGSISSMEDHRETHEPEGSLQIAAVPSMISILKELSKFEVNNTVTIFLFGNGEVQLCEEGYMPTNYLFHH